MSRNQRILLAIALFVAAVLGSFIWFIATWDPTQRQPVTQLAPVAAAEAVA